MFQRTKVPYNLRLTETGLYPDKSAGHTPMLGGAECNVSVINCLPQTVLHINSFPFARQLIQLYYAIIFMESLQAESQKCLFFCG